jgi:predicted ATP-grasp superfamily ATP-dependent carboligase
VPRVLLFGWNDHLLLEVVRCLGQGNIKVFVLGPRRLPPVRFSRYCDGYERLPPHAEPRGVEEVLERRCRGAAYDVVVPADDHAVRFAARWEPPRGVARFPLPDSERVELALDKWCFTERCRALDIPVPRTRRVDAPEQLRALAGETPFFVKPVFGANSEGAAHLRSPADVDAWLGRERWRPLLVQEFIPGEDVDVSALCEHGKVLAWTSQRNGSSPYARRLQPESGALHETRRLLEALKWHGLAHVDLRHDPRDGSHKVLELNPRFWMSVMFSMWAGVNFATLAVFQALGFGVTSPEMSSGVYERPMMRLGTLVEAARRFSEPGNVARQLWADPIPQAWRKLERAAKSLADRGSRS